MDNKILYTAKFTHHDLNFHKVWWKSDIYKMWKLVRADGQTDRPIPIPPPPTMFAEGIKNQVKLMGKILYSILLKDVYVRYGCMYDK